MANDKDALVIPGWVMRSTKFDPVDRLILSAIEDAGDKGCFYTNAELASIVNISTRTVVRTVGNLTALGYIKNEQINAWTRRLTIAWRDE